MKWVVRILQGLLAAAFLMFGAMKLGGGQAQVFVEQYGYPAAFSYVVGAVEVLGALGLLAGFWKPRLAAIAAGVLALDMAGAVFTHLRAGQGVGAAMVPAILLVLAALVLQGRRAGAAE